MAGAGRLAVVFGPEASGLTGEELARADVRVHVPTDPAHPSLNLAQAVLVVAYELRMAAVGAAPGPPPPLSPARATAGELDAAMAALRDALAGIGYLGAQNPEGVLAELRALLSRAGPTAREVTLLRGVARQVAWAAAEIARARAGPR
jgi:TrmH family RNA methyltransferase